MRKPLVQDRSTHLGRYGQKTGKGWYLYGEDRKPAPDPLVVDLIESIGAREAGIARRAISDREIVERSIYALINEGARVLEEGFALRASDIDVVYINGYGFPAWRGGPMFYASLAGLDKVLATIESFHREFGARWAARAAARKSSPPKAAPSAITTANAQSVNHEPEKSSQRRRTGSRGESSTVAPDGTLYVRSPHPLGPYPAKLTERLEHWATARAGPHLPGAARRAPEHGAA